MKTYLYIFAALLACSGCSTLGIHDNGEVMTHNDEDFALSFHIASAILERLTFAKDQLSSHIQNTWSPHGHPMSAPIDFGAREDAFNRAEKFSKRLSKTSVGTELERSILCAEDAHKALQVALKAEEEQPSGENQRNADNARYNEEKAIKDMQRFSKNAKEELLAIWDFIEDVNVQLTIRDAEVRKRMRRYNRFGDARFF